jgi:hypothetical protein
MTRSFPSRCIFVFLVFLLQGTGAGCRAQQPGGAAPQPSEPPRDVAYDHDLTDRARVLAGLAPEQPEYLATVIRQPAWQSWQRDFDATWVRAKAAHLDKMQAWRDTDLSSAGKECGTLLYPFSGPDILNAYLLFPDCNTYVLFGLEPVGSLPAPEKLPPARLERLLGDIGNALEGPLVQDYFITRRMATELETSDLHGNLPVMAIFLARLGAKIVAIRQLEVTADGKLRELSENRVDQGAAPAVEIVFLTPAGQPQTAVYVRAQAQDSGLRRSGVVAFLETQAPFVTLLKSASYLLHTKEFSILRELLLSRSRVILQDDSGIPFRFLQAPEWQVTLYGRYLRPVKDFNYGYQQDLAKAYTTGSSPKPLDFSYGYHREIGTSAVMLAVRTKASAPANQ